MMGQSKTFMLEVPDAEERDTFLSNAREVWNRSHPEKQKEPGRHGDKRIIAVLRDVLVNPPRKSLPSIKNLTKLVETKFNDKTYMALKFSAHELEPAAADTIYRYAKLTVMLSRWATEDRERKLEDVAWFSGNVPASAQAVKEILDIVSAIQPDITKVIESLNNIPRIVSESRLCITPARSKSLQKAVLDFQKSVRPAAGK